jgi:hypothetical protein
LTAEQKRAARAEQRCGAQPCSLWPGMIFPGGHLVGDDTRHRDPTSELSYPTLARSGRALRIRRHPSQPLSIRRPPRSLGPGDDLWQVIDDCGDRASRSGRPTRTRPAGRIRSIRVPETKGDASNCHPSCPAMEIRRVPFPFCGSNKGPETSVLGASFRAVSGRQKEVSSLLRCGVRTHAAFSTSGRLGHIKRGSAGRTGSDEDGWQHMNALGSRYDRLRSCSD